jgi:hypothetical protein
MLRALLLTAAVGGLAVAAPVPKAPPPPAPKASANLTLGTASLNGQLIQIVYEGPPAAVVGNPGAAVRPLVRRVSVNLATVKVTTADGTELTGDDLTKKLADSPAVARSTVAIDPEWKKLFADDVLFIEPNGKPGVGFGPPGGGAVAPGGNPFNPGGGAVIRPGVIRPALPVVPPPVEVPPVEKKEEKK